VISRATFDSILATFDTVFPHVTIWYPTTRPVAFFYLVGSRDPQRFNPAYIDAALRKREIADSTRFLRFHNSQDVLSCYFADKDDLQEYLREHQPRINSDFSPFVEFDTDQSGLVEKEMLGMFLDKVRSNSLHRHLDTGGWNDSKVISWLEEYDKIFNVAGCMIRIQTLEKRYPILESISDGLKVKPDYLPLLEKQKEFLSSTRALLKQDRDRDILAGIDTLLARRKDCGLAWLIRSWVMQKNKQKIYALESAIKAARYLPESGITQTNLGTQYLAHKKIDSAITHLDKATQYPPIDPTAYFNLGSAWQQKGDQDKAATYLQEGLRIQPNHIRARKNLAAILIRLRKYDQALEHYREILRQDPGDTDSHNVLKQLEALP
jgi:tetratricopeptide (TPR) repeat protein